MTGVGQTAKEWLPVELEAGHPVEPDNLAEESAAWVVASESERTLSDAGMGRVLERAERAQSALREVEARAEEGDERARLAAEADVALRRAEEAEAAAREAAAVADRLAEEVASLADRVVAQEQELEELRQQDAAALGPQGEPEPPAEAEPEWEPQSEPDPEPEPEPELEAAQLLEREIARGPAWAININRVTFDQLRGIGLSMNQAARLIGQREQRGGFSSLDELDNLRGLPHETIELLKRAARG